MPRLNPRGRTAAAVLLPVASLLACTGGTDRSPEPDPGPFVGYATPEVLTSYNTHVPGAGTGALGRVQPGLSYLGPDGVPLADTDLGTVVEVAADPLTLFVTLDPAAVFSDGAPLDCDDLVLTWIGGRGTDGFTPGSRTGWSDVADVACADGERTATVTFAAGRPRQEWRGLLGAGSLLPAHVLEQRSAVPDLVAAVRSGDVAALTAAARFWNTGWNLVPGQLDPALLPSAGPYRVDSLTPDGVLTLVVNPTWWGDVPRTPRVVVHLGVTDAGALLGRGEVQAAEVDGALGPVRGATAGTQTSYSAEQLVLGTVGSLTDLAVRRAFAQCVPRRQLLADRVLPIEPDAVLLDSRTTVPGDVAHPGVVAGRPDLGTASPGAGGGTEVRIGYRGPDPARAEAVALVAQACAPAGFTVTDAASPTVTRTDLAAQGLDVLLDAPSGSLLRDDRLAALRSGSASNVGGYANARVDQIVDTVAVSASAEEQAALLAEAEAILWAELPTLPLHLQPRTTVLAEQLVGAVPNPTAAGIGWNIDRWAERR